MVANIYIILTHMTVRVTYLMMKTQIVIAVLFNKEERKDECL